MLWWTGHVVILTGQQTQIRLQHTLVRQTDAAMIQLGHSLCLPSSATVQELFSVARDANIIPDISLDPVLTSFLSLDSSAALQHQYVALQRSMSREQQTAFNLNLTAELGCCTVVYGGVGVVALALSMIFDQVAQQIRAQGSTQSRIAAQKSKTKRIFGISSSSRIGWLIQNYLNLVPGVANNEEEMAETTELYDNWLNLELLDHYERMTTKKRMSTESMQQWLTGAAVHLHMRIHQVRLHSVPLGSAESLRFSYKNGLKHLVEGYAAYLRRNILETEASGPQKTKPGPAGWIKTTNTSIVRNVTCSNVRLLNASLISSADKVNDTTPSSAAGNNSSCKTDGSREDFGVSQLEGSNKTTECLISRRTLNTSVPQYDREEDNSKLGLLVIEPQRKVNHSVQHHPCESEAIQQALVSRVMKAQDLQRNRNFFVFPKKVLYSLLRQKDDFVLRNN